MRRVAPPLLALLLAACAPQPVQRDTGSGPGGAGGALPPAGDAPTQSATALLVEQGRAALAAGDNARSAAAIERALRIEPRNPWLWIELGRVHLSAGNLQQTESSALKALTLAGPDGEARAAAEELLGAGRR